MVLVSVTRLRLRSWRYLPGFILWSGRAIRQARAASGNLHAAVMRDRHGGFWTCTVWESEAAMRRFMLSGAHRRAMPRLAAWCEAAARVHWSQQTAEPPSWHEAWLRLRDEGRPSRLDHPSPAHLAHEIPPID
ncbi:MAG: DUF3291 domain-containing protein [Alphaproteobacteria bacterium]|nr:DUF3291 domain-containing protein [Alphaproteobacteria bacterium]